MAKELTKEEMQEQEQAGQRFVGTSDEFEFVGDESEVTVIEVTE